MLGDKLRSLRKDAGDSQEKLGEKLYVAGTTICSWEQGRSLPDCEKLLAICQCYHVSADYLLGLSQQQYSPSRFTEAEQAELKQFEDYLLFRRQAV